MQKFDVFAESLRAAVPERFSAALRDGVERFLVEMQQHGEKGEWESICTSLTGLAGLMKLLKGRTGNDAALYRCFLACGDLWLDVQALGEEKRKNAIPEMVRQMAEVLGEKLGVGMNVRVVDMNMRGRDPGNPADIREMVEGFLNQIIGVGEGTDVEEHAFDPKNVN